MAAKPRKPRKPRKPSASRSRNMAAIRSKDTKPEMILRRLLHRAGYRYRLHSKKLPGKPDLHLKKWNAVIEVQGCFFHAHNCHLVKQPPKDNADFWSEKLAANVARDERTAAAIQSLGIRRLLVWQCALTGRTKLSPQALLKRIETWLHSDTPIGEIRGDD